MPAMTNPNTQQFSTWIKDHRIGEVECLVPDINGVLRGKVAGRKIRLQP
jgi:glutamine synthetase